MRPALAYVLLWSGCTASVRADEDGSSSGSWELILEEEQPEPPSCVGSWSSCDEACEKIYTLDAGGEPAGCTLVDGDTATCDPGEDACPADEPQPHASAFGLTLAPPASFLEGGCDDCETCAEIAASGSHDGEGGDGADDACMDQFLVGLADVLGVSERRLHVLSVLPTGHAGTLLFLCELTTEALVSGEATTSEGLQALEHMVDTPEISIYLLGSIIQKVEIMDGDADVSPPPPPPDEEPPPPPPPPAPAPEPASGPDNGGADEGGIGGDYNGDGRASPNEHFGVREVIIIIFGGLSGIALLVFALHEGDDDDYDQLEDMESHGVQTGKSLSPTESGGARKPQPDDDDGALFRAPSAPVLGNGNMERAAMTRQARAGSAPGGMESTLEPAEGEGGSGESALDASMDTASISDSGGSSLSAYASADTTPDRGRRRRAGLTDLSDSSAGSVGP